MQWPSPLSLRSSPQPFPQLRRRRNWIRHELYVYDQVLEGVQPDADVEHQTWVTRKEIRMRNLTDELAEIDYVLDYFERLQAQWPLAFRLAFAVIIVLSLVLSLMAYLRVV